VVNVSQANDFGDAHVVDDVQCTGTSDDYDASATSFHPIARQQQSEPFCTCRDQLQSVTQRKFSIMTGRAVKNISELDINTSGRYEE